VSLPPVVVSIQRPKPGGERIEQYLRTTCTGTDASIRKAVDRLLKDPEAHTIEAPPWTFRRGMEAGAARREAPERMRMLDDEGDDA
jgi:hypothetical protein